MVAGLAPMHGNEGIADLHRHLDGSLRASTLREFADALGLVVPDALRFHDNMGLTAALRRFSFILQTLQTPQAVRRVASEVCEDASAEGVSTLEIRFAPQLHGAPLPKVVDAALDGINGRAGLILCGLYGDDPALVRDLVDLAASRAGVVAIDLAGGPVPGASWQLLDYADAFRAARDAGLGRTVHAAEGRDVAEIDIAVRALHAQRIGHGTTLLNDPQVVDLVLARGVTIEACPTSNVHTGAIASIAEHPLGLWLSRGIKVCVCSDNTLLSDVTATQELDAVVTALGLSDQDRARLVANGHDAAFA